MKSKESLVKSTTWLSILLGFMCLISAFIMIIPVYYACAIIFSLAQKASSSPEKTKALLLAIFLLITTVIKIGLSLANIILGFKTRKARKFTHHNQSVKTYSLVNMILTIILVVNLIMSFIFNLTLPFIKWFDLAISILLILNIVLFILLLFKKDKDNLAPQ